MGVREGTNKESIIKPAPVKGNQSSSHWEVLGHRVEHISELISLRGKETGVVILKLDCQHSSNSSNW